MKLRDAFAKYNYFLIKYESLVLALPFSMTAIIVTVNYTLGIAFVPNPYTRYSNYLQELVFFIMIISLSLIVLNKFSLFAKVLFSLPILFYLVSFIISALLFGITSYLVSYLLYFLAFGIPAYLVGTIVAKKGREANFILGLNKWSFFVLPVTVHYIILEFANTKPDGVKSGYLGNYTYMTFAYMILPFIFSWFLNLLYCKNSFCESKKNRGKAFNILMIFIFWISILYSGTRGAILCVLFFAVCITLYSLIVRHKNRIAITLVACMIFVFFLLGSFLPALKMTRLSRLDTLKNLVSDYKIAQFIINNRQSQEEPKYIKSTSSEGTSSESTSSESTSSEGTSSESTSSESTSSESTSSEGTSSEGTSSEPASTDNKNNTDILKDKIGNARIFLYSAAIQEIKDNPLIGLGPLGFFYKYNPQYPHNIFLELIVECGIIGGLAVIYLVISFFKLAVLGKRKLSIMLIFLLLSGYAMYYMISGTVWNNSTLLFFLGYSVHIRKRYTPHLSK